MSSRALRLIDTRGLAAPLGPRLPLGRHLVERGTINSEQLVQALELQISLGAPLGEILIAEGWATPDDVETALAEQNGLRRIDMTLQPPDPSLCEMRDAAFWLGHRVVPWIRLGNTVMVATARPDLFDRIRPDLGAPFSAAIPVLASETQITQAIARQFTSALAAGASARVAPEFSCRTWRRLNRVAVPAVLGLLVLGALVLPMTMLVLVSLLAVLTTGLFMALKTAGFIAHLAGRTHLSEARPSPKGRLPKVSVLVPLYREKEIAGALIRRLARLSYPKALLDVILVLEARDQVTRKTVAETELPGWMRVIEVPEHGGLTTKPRAMNYALDFCRGDIVGVWDAEDAPAEDQIQQVVARFETADKDVVCLQGVLDYYNPRTNWLSRCFTIEYASWFRIVLPGIARLGLVVPLGGTTLFFRRAALEELGGWDAHNVTEDADLGVRLCRKGYRTELIETVTREEANCRPWPWVKQRSRWLKGFMVTYLVHMRQPAHLLRDLGLRRFLGFQAFFLGTLGQFLLAPVLWSYWLILLGFGHPLESVVARDTLVVLASVFMGAEMLAIAIGLVAVSHPDRRFLMKWVPTMMFYFPLGSLAAYKALYELVMRPYYWDKTQHGVAKADPGTL